MARKLFDNVRHLIVTPGYGAIALGTVPATWQSFAAAGAVDGDNPPYELVDGDARENGYLTLADSVTTATRTVVTSTNGGNPIELTGSAVLTCTPIAGTFNDDLLSVVRDQGLSAGAKAMGLANLGATARGAALFASAGVEFRNYLSGLTLSNYSNTTITVAAGVATDSTNSDVINLAAAIQKTTSPWAAGTGSGGLDTSTIAPNTWYHFYLIKRPDTGEVDVLFSLSSTSPAMPSNYTLKRRIGALKTDGVGHWVLFAQEGDSFLLSVPVLDVNLIAGSNPLSTSAGQLLTLGSVPTGLKVTAMISGYGYHATLNGRYIYISSPDQADSAPSDTYVSVSSVAGVPAAFFMLIRTDASARIRARALGGSTGLSITTAGWVDRRGRDG